MQQSATIWIDTYNDRTTGEECWSEIHGHYYSAERSNKKLPSAKVLPPRECTKKQAEAIARRLRAWHDCEFKIVYTQYAA